MNDHLIVLPVIGSLVGGVVLIIKIIADTHIKRKIITSGVSDELAKILIAKTPQSTSSVLKWGLVVLGIGVAQLVLPFIPEALSPAFYNGLMFTGAGAGLLLFYLIKRRQEQRETNHTEEP